MSRNNLRDNLITSLIRILLVFPTRLTHRIIFFLLKHAQEGPLPTKFGFLIHFRFKNPPLAKIDRDVIIGWYEDRDLMLIKRFIRPGDYVIDVGAYKGYYTMFMSKIVGRNGKVFSFEPNKSNIYFLRKNIEHNSLANVEIIEKACDKEKAEKDPYLDRQDDTGGTIQRFSYYDTYKTEKVGVDRLDSYLKDLRHAVSFIKIDTEGNDFNVIMGAEKIIEKDAPTLCFEVSLVHWAYLDLSISRLFEYLKSKGYETFFFGNGKLMPYRLFYEKSTNMFAIHSSRIAEWADIIAR